MKPKSKDKYQRTLEVLDRIGQGIEVVEHEVKHGRHELLTMPHKLIAYASVLSKNNYNFL